MLKLIKYHVLRIGYTTEDNPPLEAPIKYAVTVCLLHGKMIVTSLLTVLFLGTVVSSSPVVQIRNPPISVSLARMLNLNVTLGIRNLLQHDQARAQALQARVGAKVDRDLSLSSAAVIGNEPLDNHAFFYTASIGVGSPPTTCEYGSYYM